jgi:putative two-component system response regulator
MSYHSLPTIDVPESRLGAFSEERSWRSPMGDGWGMRILVVDDEEPLRRSLSRYLRLKGYTVDLAESAEAALERLAHDRYVLALVDVRLPGTSGLELTSQALQKDRDLAVIVLSAVNDAQTATEALSRGAVNYVTKPVEFDELLRSIERALHQRELTIERRRVEQMIREEVAQRTEELERERLAVHSLTINVAQALINAMEAKDVYLRGHSQRVSELGASIAQEMGLDEDTVEYIRLAGRLADVGKIGTREEVLNKPDRLTPEEYEHVKDHVRIGMEILAPLHHLGPALNYVHDHHERWDGSGYPRGLAGEAISIGGRILAAADAFDALTSKRAYREPLGANETLEYLASQSGALLDPAVYAALRTVMLGGKSISLTFID